MPIRLLAPAEWKAGNKILHDVFVGENHVSPSVAHKLTIEENVNSGTWIGSFDSNNTLVGLVLLTSFSEQAARVAQPGGAEIRLLAVLPKYRRSSNASDLVGYASKWSCLQGRTTLTLSTQETMLAAQHLYRRLGYRELTDLGYFSMGKRFVVFQKVIKSSTS